jgi:hypothetical protein
MGFGPEGTRLGTAVTPTLASSTDGDAAADREDDGLASDNSIVSMAAAAWSR